MGYKYSELQVSTSIQKLSCKASCKTPFFLIVGLVEEIEKKNLIVIPSLYQIHQTFEKYRINLNKDFH
jgi:hypothetical protein